MRKMIFDDGFQAYLTEGANVVGDAGIPMLMNLNNTQIPKGLVPFTKINTCKNKRQYVHFYIHDVEFARVLTSTDRYLETLKLYDGVITPDCTILIGQSKCLQETNTYMSRAVGFYLQKNGIPVIPNVRWGDDSTFDFCFLGIPKNTIVSISTHGCIRSNSQKDVFKNGLQVMLKKLEPSAILVYGYMPESVFGGFTADYNFYRYPSEFELTHSREVS